MDLTHDKCNFLPFSKYYFFVVFFRNLKSGETESANGCAIMVLFVKNLPKRNLHFSFLYLRQVFE